MIFDPHNRLVGVHSDLINVLALAYQKSPVKFKVIEGLRTKERQRKLVEAGASKTMKSRHLTGHAVDVAALVDGEVRWEMNLYSKINLAVQEAAQDLGIPVEWGGAWKTFKDGPHFQLPWKVYP